MTDELQTVTLAIEIEQVALTILEQQVAWQGLTLDRLAAQYIGRCAAVVETQHGNALAADAFNGLVERNKPEPQAVSDQPAVNWQQVREALLALNKQYHPAQSLESWRANEEVRNQLRRQLPPGFTIDDFEASHGIRHGIVPVGKQPEPEPVPTRLHRLERLADQRGFLLRLEDGVLLLIPKRASINAGMAQTFRLNDEGLRVAQVWLEAHTPASEKEG